MDPLEKFVDGLSDEEFDYLNRNRAFARRLVDEYDDRQRAMRGDVRAQARIAEIDSTRGAPPESPSHWRRSLPNCSARTATPIPRIGRAKKMASVNCIAGTFW